MRVRLPRSQALPWLRRRASEGKAKAAASHALWLGPHPRRLRLRMLVNLRVTEPWLWMAGARAAKTS